MQQGQGFKCHGIVAAALCVAAVTGAVIAQAPLNISSSFEKALSTSRNEFNFSAPHENRPGDEGYWLTRAEVQSPALLLKPVAIGDHITISGQDGNERKLEVVDVRWAGAEPKGGDSAGLLLVTARISDAIADKGIVRFIVEGQIGKPAQPQKAVSKAL